MTKASIDLQDLRRRIYVKAKAEPSWRFWGLYVHVCKMETLRAAYEMAKSNDGAPGIDGVTFEAIEAQGVEALLEQLRDELIGRTYQPLPARRQEIPKDGGKFRVLSIPAIRDRVVQGALKLILEPVFEADFQPGSFGYRPKRTAHDAVKRVAEAIVRRKTRVLDLDLRAYFDNVRHDRLLAKVAQRIDDADVMHLLKVMLKASGKKGVPQGGVISPLLSNLYLNEVDKMLERAREVTRNGKYTYIEYARFADDLVILIDAYKRHDWLVGAVDKRLREEFGNVVNKTKDLFERFSFFADQYDAKRAEAERRVDERVETRRDNGYDIHFPTFGLRREAKWLALSAIESFFSWAEHVFILLAILRGNVVTGDAVAKLAAQNWDVKFKAALDVNDPDTKRYYDDLIIVRRQLRNFVAHGSFGKQGEAFLFHSSAGAVPVRLPHHQGASFRFGSGTDFVDHEAITLLHAFIDHLWSGSRSPARIYLQEYNLPLILTMAQKGEYARAMASEDDMTAFAHHLAVLMDRHADMDF